MDLVVVGGGGDGWGWEGKGEINKGKEMKWETKNEKKPGLSDR